MPAPTFTRPIQGTAPNQFVESTADVAALNAALLDLWHAIVSGADEQAVADLVTTLSGLRSAAQTAQAGAVTAQGLAETARDEAEQSAGIVSQATSVAGLTDPTTLPVGDEALVLGSGDDAVDGLYQVQDNTPKEWVRIRATGLAGKASKESLAEVRDSGLISEGNALSDLVMGFSEMAGASRIGDYGLSIANGSTGNLSFIQGRLTLGADAAAGRRILLTVGFDLSDPFTRLLNTPVLQVRLASSTVVRNSVAVITSERSGQRLIYKIEYTLQGDETGLWPYWQIAGSAVTSSVETIVMSEFIYTWLTPLDDTISVNDEALQRRIDTAKKSAILTSAITDGNVLNDLVMGFSEMGGASRVGDYGLSIPNGSAGNLSFIQTRWAVDGAANVGREITLKIGFDISDPFTRLFNSLVLQVGLASSSAIRNDDAVITSERSGQRLIYTITYTLQGDEIGLWPYLQIAGSAITSSVETLVVTDFVYAWSEPENDTISVNEEALQRRFAGSAIRSIAYGGVPALRYDRTAIVAPSGGDYTSPADALAAITDASAGNRYLLRVRPGVYEDPEWFDKDFIDLVGESKEESHIKFHQPNDTTPLLMATKSAIFQRNNSRLEGLLITAKNARYAIHLESDGNIPDTLQEIVNCHIEHFGNDDGVGNYWGAQYAIGSGNSSGQVIRIVDTTCVSKRRGGFSYHTNVDFKAPSRVELIRSRFIALQADQNSFELQPLGSFQADVAYAEGCVFSGDIVLIVSPWLPTSVTKQPADHNEITLTGHGNSPAVFRNLDFGEALRIDSATTGTSSSVVIAGDAVADIFGDTLTDRYFQRAGSAGFSAAVWGWGDISTQQVGLNKNVLNKTLGQRLGDCSGTSKTLTVTVDGGSPITVTFDQNHTAQDNATVLGIINTALGSAATASIYQPGARKRPMFGDEERAPKNTSGSGIFMGMVLAYNNSVDAVRPMTSADDASLFAGVAWEDIADGDCGRVKFRGYLPITDVLRSDSGALTFGATMSVGATPGYVQAGGTQGLLRAIRSDAVEVGK